ncbi:MAG: hypothetical protein WCQ95_14905 [Bacteroidota bacterium]
MNKNLPKPYISQLGEMADDVLYSIILLTVTDRSNVFLPFLYGHALELSAKAAGIELNVDDKILNSHDIIPIYESIAKKLPTISQHIPTEEHIREYKNVWVSSGHVLTKNIDILNPKHRQPTPNELKQWELAYFIENVKNLKYGFDKKKIFVSIIQITYNGLNPYFLNLFLACRNIYCIPSSNERLKKKVYPSLEKVPGIDDLMNNIFNKHN